MIAVFFKTKSLFEKIVFFVANRVYSWDFSVLVVFAFVCVMKMQSILDESK